MATVVVPLKRDNHKTMTPTSINQQNSSGLVAFPNYNTFNDVMQDSGGIEDYDELQSVFSLYSTMHPTQSRFSMYSMQSIQQMSQISSDKNATKADKLYSNLGNWYRKFCFTEIGMKCMLSINAVLLFLNLFLIIYEIVLIYHHKSYLDTALPILFFICEIIITFILVIEVLFHWFVGYQCSCYHYLCNSTYDNMIDVFVMIISLLCCVIYIADSHADEDDNLIFLSLRIIRDIIRIIRCLYFFKLLYGNLSGNMIRQKSLKSNKSQLFWDEFVKQKAIHPTKSVVSIRQSKSKKHILQHAVEPVQEFHDNIDEDEEIDYDFEQIVYVPSKIPDKTVM